MTDDLRARAEARLAAVCQALEAADPREALRARLRALRESAPAVFDAARVHFEGEVLPQLASAAAPADAWIEYGRYVGELSGPGRVLAIDAAGRAVDHESSVAAGTLVLFLPDDAADEALLILEPAAPSAAQRATCTLLVSRRLAL